MRLRAAWRSNAHRPVILGIGLLLALYALATCFGWTSALAAHEDHGRDVAEIANPWAVMPFVLLLAAIAVFPLLERTEHWWDRNANKLLVAGGLGLATLAYVALAHPTGSIGAAARTLAHVFFAEYIPFMVLLFSLYTTSGGIRIAGDLPAHAWTNTLFIAVGGVLASFVGTTGAAMLLVRALLDTNSERKHVAHTVVFFIFVACNCGGLLLPIGDPPLLLGYLRGVDFLWTLSLWKSWLFVNGALLAIYFLIDHFYCYPREKRSDIEADETRVRKLSVSGLWPNLALLIGIVLAVACLDPARPLAGTAWHPWPLFREAVQLTLVAASLLWGSGDARRANQFDFTAIIEVAVLFIGIFVAMQPALEILQARGATLGIETPHEFFWATGWLSAVLDNAPTYLVFFEAARTISHPAGDQVAGIAEPLLAGIALGSVTFGAMTYVGNGPNFMVKSIAEKSGVPMPGFFGYMAYSVTILLPVLALDAWLFLA